jgi:two-component system phosphate regulon sensor histidine kinase PhoR
MTHELKTPISTIGISAKVIADPDIVNQPERLSNYAEIIVHQNKRMEQQVEKVLQSTLSEKGRIQLEFEQIHLTECLDKVKNELSLKAEEKGGKIQLETDEYIPPILADKNHFENLMFNLLDNAIKYSIESPLVYIYAHVEKGKIKISVSDNGIGMNPDQIKRIFQKFYRVPTGDVHDVKGFGLGLDYVKNIVKAHKWSIEVDSELGKGSVFSIFIPLK